jgi:uncharacterized SAM-binding protein YcdF (DUF218 family)
MVVLVLWAIFARGLAPRANTARQIFDAIVVLGTPADADGNPTPALLDRVSEAVREYQRGVAPRLILTGGAAHNAFVEADVMARIAESQGVPAGSILKESQALDTIQNACYSERILKQHGWHSAEIVSNTGHLPRAALILSKSKDATLQWRVHAAPEDLTPAYYRNAATLIEVLKTARYLVWSQWAERCDP